jgi:AcrR family transcriptional regulator
MKEETSVKRAYRAPNRAALAQATRLAVIDAGASLFVERGYGAVSIDDIADAAGVVRATVFNAVGGKAAVLRAAYDVALVGDDEPVPLPERLWARPVREAPDGPTMLDRYAHMITVIDQRVGPVYEVLRGAATAHADVREHWDEIRAGRRTGAENVVKMLAAHGPLRRGLTRAAAADIVELYIDPGHHQHLVAARGWSARAFERWLAQTLRAQLLG